MQISAIQSQLTNSTRGMQLLKTQDSNGLTQDLTTDSFSKEKNKISFEGLTSGGKTAGTIAGIAAGVAAAIAAAPLTIIAAAAIGVGALAAAVNNDDDDHSNTDKYFGP